MPRASPTRPRSRSRTRACLTKCRRAPARSRRRSRSRPRPRTCSRSSADRRSILMSCSRRCWPRPSRSVGSRGGTICVRDGDGFRYRAVAEGRDSAMWRVSLDASPDPRTGVRGGPGLALRQARNHHRHAPGQRSQGSRALARGLSLRRRRASAARQQGRGRIDGGARRSRTVRLSDKSSSCRPSPTRR